MEINNAKKSGPSKITKADITSNFKLDEQEGPNKGKPLNASLVNGILRMTYYESVLQDSIKANIVYGDVGNAVEGKSAIEGLPIVGTEDFRLEFEDNSENKIKVDMNVNTVTPVYEDSQKNVVSMELVSEEFLLNEMGDTRLRSRFNGKVSEHIKQILEKNLKTEKELHIEDALNEYNFIGNGRKPYYMMNLLSKQGIPIDYDKRSAGFLFFETSEGFHFKSLEGLFNQKQKKSYIFNNSTDIQGTPAGYDGKILKYQSNSTLNVQSKMNMGAYKTKIVLFDAYNCKYMTETHSAYDEDSAIESVGQTLPKFNAKFDSEQFKNEFTRTTLYMVDSGSLPGAKSTEEQIKANTADNFKAISTLNQSIRRYNQLFSGMMEVTIAGDFSLHAGDVIFVDIFSVQAEKDDTVNRESGGLYIIADLCHFVNADGTYTKLNLARDSFGRKGNHTTRV